MQVAPGPSSISPRPRLRAFDFLSMASKEYLELSADDSLFLYIGRKIAELAGPSAVTISSFLKDTGRFQLHCLVQSLEAESHPKIQDGIDLFFQPGERLMGHFLLGKLGRVQHRERAGFSRPFMDQVLRLEEIHGPLSLHAAGFTWRNEILGSAVIMVPKGRRIRNRTLTEVFARLASIAIRWRQDEFSLRESEEKYRQLVEHAPSGIYEVDFVKGRFVEVNDLMCEYTGYTKKELLAMSPLQILAEESKGPFLDRMARVQRGERVPDTVEFKIVGKQGRTFWVILNVRYFWEQGVLRRATVVVHDITELKRAEAALRESEEKLHFLSSQLMKALEEERKRIARELHDQLGQDLMVLKLQLRSLQERIQGSDPEAVQDVERIRDYIHGIAENVRRLSRNLSPAILEDLGLQAALRWLIEEAEKLYGIDITSEIEDLEKVFSGGREIVLFRIFQEALTNIGKHSRATHVRIASRVEGGSFSLVIEDDGIGLDPEKALGTGKGSNGFGLTTMQERARMIGGRLQIRSRKGAGCKIRLEIPVESGERNRSGADLSSHSGG